MAIRHDLLGDIHGLEQIGIDIFAVTASLLELHRADASTYTAVVSLVEATGAFSEIKAIELLTASEIDRGSGKSLTYRAPGA